MSIEIAAVVDANNQAAKCYTAAERPEQAFAAQVRRWRSEFTSVDLCWDSAGPGWREQLYPQYKAERRGRRLAEYGEFLQAVQRQHGGTSLQGYEADDLIAGRTLAHVEAGRRVVIVSSDKDVWQLLKDGQVTARTRDTSRHKAYQTAASLYASKGVHPEQWADYLTLVGDATDAIPGVPGIGPKRARLLLEAHGSLEQIYWLLDRSQLPASMAVLKALASHRDSGTLQTTSKLVRLRPPTGEQ